VAIPTEELAQHWSNVLPVQWSVIRGPISSLEAPAVVLRADEPWIIPSAFCHDQQNYAAVAVVSASTPQDGEAELHSLSHLIMDNLIEGWEFVSVSRPVVDQSTGTPYLAAIIRLRYLNNPPEAS
jgi:hypothetical protein